MVQTYLSSDGECCYAGIGSGFDISTISLDTLFENQSILDINYPELLTI